MSEKELGYFAVQRSLLEHEIWQEKPFSKGQAWIDLIGRANFRKTERMVGCDLVTIPRGQLVTSIGALAERWGWSKNKVLRYIKTLEDAKMVTTKRTRYGTFITVEKYSVYQIPRNTDETANETEKRRRRDGDETEKGYTRIKNNKDNKGNKDNKAPLYPSEPEASRPILDANGEELVEPEW